MDESMITMSELDVIRRQAAENEGLDEDATWEQIFTHFRLRVCVTTEELALVAGVREDQIKSLELYVKNVDAKTRALVWDALCYLEGC